MSVLACNRGNCENIMCDRYSHKYGYLCNQCLEELYLKPKNTDLSVFMGEDTRHADPIELADFWQQEFISRW